jgi:hypothetical protein
VVELPPPAIISYARTPLEYRKDGASHLYGHNGHRIFKGKLPPLLHAVGVLQVEVDNRGNVRNLNWMRAPSHVPDVMREIERTVHSAAPFPAPVSLGGVVYTDVWLWDRSGHFQLDTLTEGQRNRLSPPAPLTQPPPCCAGDTSSSPAKPVLRVPCS